MTLVHAESVKAALAELLQQTGIDLSTLPPVMSTNQLAPALGITSEALAQDRYRGCGIPYVKWGRVKSRDVVYGVVV
jgi:hypothetical protein